MVRRLLEELSARHESTPESLGVFAPLQWNTGQSLIFEKIFHGKVNGTGRQNDGKTNQLGSGLL
jgi:hypothetical protein